MDTRKKTIEEPRMADIAEAVGVSVMTVSRAFRSDTRVKPRTRALILSKAEELGYVFDATAANLRQQKSGFVAVTIPSINNANFAETVRELSRTLSHAGLQILLANTDYDPEEEERLVEQLLRRRPEAVVLTSDRHTERTVRRLEATRIPIVQMWDVPQEPIRHFVGFSNGDCVERLVEHLCTVGYRRIAFLGGDTERDVRGGSRRAGFERAMSARGLDPTRLVPTGRPPVGMTEGAEALSLMLDWFPDTEAVIGVSDLVAFGALSECQRRGISVPGELSIAGFGNYEIGRISHPSLTTIDVQAGKIGRKVAEMVVEMLSGERIGANPIGVHLKPDLLVRQSTQRP